MYTIEAAKQAPSITRLVVSTDDGEIAAIAEEAGVVVIDRPQELAQDDTPDLPAIQHALKHLEESENYVPDTVVHLRPTTPLKAASDIGKGIQLLFSRPDADSVRSVCQPLHTPFKMYIADEETGFLAPLLPNVFPEVFERHPEAFNMPRQLLPTVWRHSGYVDVIRTAVIEGGSLSGTRILPLFFEEWRDIDIDSMKEIKFAEHLIRELREAGKEPWQD
jgi:CMP-N-acetylneuraminic acid synthetase